MHTSNMSKIEPGEPAPDFSLYDSAKQLVSLSSLKGETLLLLFFPLAFTSTCTNELCGVRDSLVWYEGVNAHVFGISVDSIHTLAKYKEEQQLNFSLLSDFNKEVSRKYDTIYENFGYNMKGVSKRSAFIIDKAGIIRHKEVLEDAGKVPDFATIKTVLERLHKL